MLDSFQNYAQGVRPILNEGLTTHLAHLLGDAKAFQSAGENKILMGGKRIRGALLCLVTRTLGGSLEDALSRAISVELIQAATLIHDDFVDQHRLRRNCPTIWTLEGARKAVLLGDLIFASAIQLMSELGKEDGLIISRAIAEVSLGAFREPLNPSSLLEEIEADRKYATLYEKIIHLKTGTLFGAACQLGAVAAQTNNAQQKKWRSYGLRIGEAYQIADDLHEMEQYVLARSVTASGISSLAPALLFFAEDIRPYMIEALRQKSTVLSGEFLEHFQAAKKEMKAHMESRLHSAVSAVERDFPDNEYSQLARKTPWDIIQMFNDERLTVSSP